MKKGLFIVFEGIDGAGTTTQCQLLAEKTAAAGYPAVLTREPGGTPMAEAIRTLVLNPEARTLTDLSELLLYAASRAQHVNEKIKPALARGDNVICDRFTASTWAYQGYGRGIDLDLIAKVTEIAEDHCRPDLTILLSVPAEVAAARRSRRAASPDRLESAGEDFLNRVQQGYRNWAKMEPRTVTLDGSRAPDQIASEVWNTLTKRWPAFPGVLEPDQRTDRGAR